MATTLVASIADTKLRARWQEPYLSEAINKILSGFPDGVVRGFVPSFPGGMVLRFTAEDGLSVLRVRAAGNAHTMTYMETGNLDLDLTAVASSTVYIGVEVTYVLSATTTGTIKAYTAAEYAAAPLGVCWLGKVAVPAGPGPLLGSHFDISVRSWPWAVAQGSELQHPWRRVDVDGDFYHPQWWRNVGQSGSAAMEIQGTTVNVSPRSLRIYLSGATTGNDDIIVSTVEKIPIASGHFVSVSFGMRTTGLFSANQAGLRLVWLDKDDAALSVSVISPGVSGAVNWAIYTGTVQAPASARSFVLGGYVNNLAAGEMFLEQIRVYSQGAAVGRVGDADSGVASRPVETPMLSFYDAISFAGQALDVYMSTNVLASGDSGLIWMPRDENVTHADSMFRWQWGATGREVAHTIYGRLAVAGHLGTALTVGGGYGSTGASITDSGNISANGELTIDGNAWVAGQGSFGSMIVTAGATFGGGYGSTGVTITTAGAISANGAVVADGNVTGANLITSGDVTADQLILNATINRTICFAPGVQGVRVLLSNQDATDQGIPRIEPNGTGIRVYKDPAWPSTAQTYTFTMVMWLDQYGGDNNGRVDAVPVMHLGSSHVDATADGSVIFYDDDGVAVLSYNATAVSNTPLAAATMSGAAIDVPGTGYDPFVVVTFSASFTSGAPASEYCEFGRVLVEMQRDRLR